VDGLSRRYTISQSVFVIGFARECGSSLKMKRKKWKKLARKEDDALTGIFLCKLIRLRRNVYACY
tara:strand:- start:272 stop:466 length:195 start_codon:yes stop_codon:yes gene_type:complete